MKSPLRLRLVDLVLHDLEVRPSALRCRRLRRCEPMLGQNSADQALQRDEREVLPQPLQWVHLVRVVHDLELPRLIGPLATRRGAVPRRPSPGFRDDPLAAPQAPRLRALFRHGIRHVMESVTKFDTAWRAVAPPVSDTLLQARQS